MPAFTQPTTPAEQESFCSLPGLSTLTPEVVARQRPDAQWLLDDGNAALARCSLWWSRTPPHDGHRLGYIGHYSARDPEAAAELLDHACRQLAAQGCTLAVGPLDGTTWARYRLLSERGAEPLFFLEPDNPDDWPLHFTANGFTPLAQYYSALNHDLRRDPRSAEVGARVAAHGIRVRPVEMARFDDELRFIYPLLLDAFAENFLYTPLPEDDYLAQYRGIRPYLRHELVHIAERDGEPVGFGLTVPDVLQAQRGQTIDTVIVKTLAVSTRARGCGLGTHLMNRSQEIAAELGFKRSIHALMIEDNLSRKISDHTARTMRRYTLYARALGTSA
jgi:GNAT superfamily N-acetyltransferase